MWNELKPGPGDPLSELPSVLTNQAVAFRTGIEKHSFWTDSSGASAGIPRLSDTSFGPGSARAFFDGVSNLSTSLNTTKPLTGRLYVTSDTSRLYLYYADGSTIQVGGVRAVVSHSGTTIPSNFRTLVQTGSFTITNNGTSVTTTAFATAYAATAPTIQLTPVSSTTKDLTVAAMRKSSVTNFAASAFLIVGGATSTVTMLWRSHGTVAL